MSESPSKKLFCFGYGYTCDYLGYDLLAKGGWKICGTTRDTAKRSVMRKNGVSAFMFDYEAPLDDPQYFMKDVTHLLISTPPGDDGDPSFLLHSRDIQKIDTLEWVGYLSSTSVYGDHHGDWVTEEMDTAPTSKRGSRRERAEEQWLDLHRSMGLPVHIFRLAGIYGLGRSALDTVRAGIAKRIEKPGHVFNRIHVEDIVSVLEASMLNPAPGEIYNVCDDHPAPSHDVIEYACELLDVSSPPLVMFEDTNLPPIARSFYNDNKRVKNDKIKEALGVSLKYHDYKEGLKGCLEAEKFAKNSFDSAATPMASNGE